MEVHDSYMAVDRRGRTVNGKEFVVDQDGPLVVFGGNTVDLFGKNDL